MIWKINLSTRTEDKKEKEAGSGGCRVKEGSESTLGCEDAQSGCEQIWGGRGSGIPGEAAPHRGRGECRGYGEMPKGFRTRMQESGVRMRGRGWRQSRRSLGALPVTGEGGEGRTDLV